jgi:hypothetical protein
LVLGFDAGCVTCSGLARKIEEKVGDKLEVRSLSDPQVEHWRKEALGEDAPWAPTLVEVEGVKVRAWTGVRMGIALSRRLGLRDTWRVMQAVGEANAASKAEGQTTQGAMPGLTRGQFLKGAGGAAVAFTMFTGIGTFASPAFARSKALDEAAEALKSVKRTGVHGRELIDVARRVAQRNDVANVMGRAWSTGVRDGRAGTATRDGEQPIFLANGARASVGPDGRTQGGDDRVVVGAMRHVLKNGTNLLVVAYELPTDKLLVYHEYDRPIPDGEGDLKSKADLLSVEGDRVITEKSSSNGSIPLLASARARCSGCNSRGGCRYTTRGCASYSRGCLVASCGGCAITCGRTLVANLRCLGCIILVCGYATDSCCLRFNPPVCKNCLRCF